MDAPQFKLVSDYRRTDIIEGTHKGVSWHFAYKEKPYFPHPINIWYGANANGTSYRYDDAVSFVEAAKVFVKQV